jgi:hypothetical protein
MAFIDSSALRPRFTSDLIAAYQQAIAPTQFLQNMFTREAKSTDYIEWNVERYGEFVAKDVVRGADGNRNQFTNMTQKVEQPPFFYEYMDVMQIEGYNRAFGSMTISESVYNDFLTRAQFRLNQLRYKIDRAYEIQAAQVLLTGKVTTQVAGPTDFKRKAASILQFDASIDWTQPTVNPKDAIEKLCDFVRTVGKEGGEFKLILGDSAYKALINNPIVQSESQKLWAVLTKPEMPKEMGDGSKYVGSISAGSYFLDCYTYPQSYALTTEVPNTSTPYIDKNAIIVVPKAPMAGSFIHAFAMVPQLPNLKGIDENRNFSTIGGTNGTGQYFISEFFDLKKTAWEVAVKSAGLTIPIGVDKIGTAFVTPS